MINAMHWRPKRQNPVSHLDPPFMNTCGKVLKVQDLNSPEIYGKCLSKKIGFVVFHMRCATFLQNLVWFERICSAESASKLQMTKPQIWFSADLEDPLLASANYTYTDTLVLSAKVTTIGHRLAPGWKRNRYHGLPVVVYTGCFFNTFTTFSFRRKRSAPCPSV